jgi:hypothetical protein
MARRMLDGAIDSVNERAGLQPAVAAANHPAGAE